MARERIEIRVGPSHQRHGVTAALISDNQASLKFFSYTTDELPGLDEWTEITNRLSTAPILEEIILCLPHLSDEYANRIQHALSNPHLKKFAFNMPLTRNLIPPWRFAAELSTTEISALAQGMIRTQLTDISLNCCIKSHDDVGILTAALKQIPTLDTLTLSHCHIGARGMRAVGDLVGSSSNLRKLDVSNNLMGYGGAKALADALATSSIQQLDISRCFLIETPNRRIKTIFNQIAVSLIDVTCNDNGINIHGAQSIAYALQHGNLRYLKLSKNNLGSAGTKILATGLPNSTLQELDLSKNKIDNSCMVSLGQAVLRSSLRRINLRDNQITSAGIIGFLPALSNPAFKSLDLRGNKIGGAGKRALIQAIENSYLEELLIDGPLTTNNVKSLEQAMLTNYSLTTFSFPLNTVNMMALTLRNERIKSALDALNAQVPINIDAIRRTIYRLEHLEPRLRRSGNQIQLPPTNYLELQYRALSGRCLDLLFAAWRSRLNPETLSTQELQNALSHLESYEPSLMIQDNPLLPNTEISKLYRAILGLSYLKREENNTKVSFAFICKTELIDLDYAVLERLFGSQLPTLAAYHLKRIALWITALPSTHAEQVNFSNDENARIVSTLQLAASNQLFEAAQSLFIPFSSPSLQTFADQLLSEVLFNLADDIYRYRLSLTKEEQLAYFQLMGFHAQAGSLERRYATLALKNLKGYAPNGDARKEDAPCENSFIDLTYLSNANDTDKVSNELLTITESLAQIKATVLGCIQRIHLAQSKHTSLEGDPQQSPSRIEPFHSVVRDSPGFWSTRKHQKKKGVENQDSSADQYPRLKNGGQEES